MCLESVGVVILKIKLFYSADNATNVCFMVPTGTGKPGKMGSKNCTGKQEKILEKSENLSASYSENPAKKCGTIL